jgi:hypothetical protein
MATLQELIDQKAALEREISAVRNEGVYAQTPENSGR